jgi:hypothetical protein
MAAFVKLLQKFQDVYANKSEQVEKCRIVNQKMDTGGNSPIKQAPRRLPCHRQEEVQKLIWNMEEQEVIERSQCP